MEVLGGLKADCRPQGDYNGCQGRAARRPRARERQKLYPQTMLLPERNFASKKRIMSLRDKLVELHKVQGTLGLQSVGRCVSATPTAAVRASW